MTRLTDRRTADKSLRAGRGFTLVELLVVIAAVAVLLAILMPGLWAARRRAKTVVCQGNLKQWGSFSVRTRTKTTDVSFVE